MRQQPLRRRSHVSSHWCELSLHPIRTPSSLLYVSLPRLLSWISDDPGVTPALCNQVLAHSTTCVEDKDLYGEATGSIVPPVKEVVVSRTRGC